MIVRPYGFGRLLLWPIQRSGPQKRAQHLTNRTRAVTEREVPIGRPIGSPIGRGSLAQRLVALATGSVARTKVAQLREVIEQVESAIAAGVPHAAIRAELKVDGLDMKASTFRATLTVLRATKPSSASAAIATAITAARPAGSTPASTGLTSFADSAESDITARTTVDIPGSGGDPVNAAVASTDTDQPKPTPQAKPQKSLREIMNTNHDLDAMGRAYRVRHGLMGASTSLGRSVASGKSTLDRGSAPPDGVGSSAKPPEPQ